MSAFSTFREAVMEDGRYVLHEVFAKLYCGHTCRPDIYLKHVKNGNGRMCFITSKQKEVIEVRGDPDAYDADEDSSGYDISLLSVLIEHTCGLSERDLLLQKVKQVRMLRNNVCHDHVDIDSENLDEKLGEFFLLLIGIIEELEERTFSSLGHVKLQVRERILTKMRKVPSRSRDNIVVSRSEGMPTWQKVALGVTAGIGALALGAAACKEDQKRKENKNKSQDECILM